MADPTRFPNGPWRSAKQQMDILEWEFLECANPTPDTVKAATGMAERLLADLRAALPAAQTLHAVKVTPVLSGANQTAGDPFPRGDPPNCCKKHYHMGCYCHEGVHCTDEPADPALAAPPTCSKCGDEHVAPRDEKCARKTRPNRWGDEGWDKADADAQHGRIWVVALALGIAAFLLGHEFARWVGW